METARTPICRRQRSASTLPKCLRRWRWTARRSSASGRLDCSASLFAVAELGDQNVQLVLTSALDERFGRIHGVGGDCRHQRKSDAFWTWTVLESQLIIHALADR